VTLGVRGVFWDGWVGSVIGNLGIPSVIILRRGMGGLGSAVMGFRCLVLFYSLRGGHWIVQRDGDFVISASFEGWTVVQSLIDMNEWRWGLLITCSCPCP